MAGRAKYSRCLRNYQDHCTETVSNKVGERGNPQGFPGRFVFPMSISKCQIETSNQSGTDSDSNSFEHVRRSKRDCGRKDLRLKAGLEQPGDADGQGLKQQRLKNRCKHQYKQQHFAEGLIRKAAFRLVDKADQNNSRYDAYYHSFYRYLPTEVPRLSPAMFLKVCLQPVQLFAPSRQFSLTENESALIANKQIHYILFEFDGKICSRLFL